MYNTPIMASAMPLATTSNKSTAARARLESQVRTGVERQKRIVELVSNMVITDALVSPSRMHFSFNKQLRVSMKEKEYLIHPHALTQMAGVLEYPRMYLNKLQDGLAGIPQEVCREKLCQDMNWHASQARLKDRRGNPAEYLVRSVDGEVRGYLSRSFKRHLASKPLMRAFLNACSQAGLEPLDGQASPVRVSLQCSLPYVFEPYPGEFVAVGITWTNSDFGSGRMKVSLSMKRVNGESSIILNDAISEVHIGPIIEDSDIEMSEETYRAELDAQRRVIEDVVIGQLKPDNIRKLLEAIKVAHEEALPWDKLKFELARLLHKKELNEVQELLTKRDGFEELPPIKYDEDDDPIPTRWWASAVLGKMAEREGDAERRKKMQELAGKIVGDSKGVKKLKKAS